MLATGWDWPTLMQTPDRVVDEWLTFHNAYRATIEAKQEQAAEKQNG